MTTKILIAAVFIAAIVGSSYAYAETFTLQVDDEYLYSVQTDKTGNQTQSDGSVMEYVTIVLGFKYPNQTVAMQNPEPVKADPLGKIFEVLINDLARIFTSSIPILPEPVEQVQEEESEEKEIELTPEQKKLKEDLERSCGELNKRLNVIGRAYNFLFEHTMEWYLDHPLHAKMKAEDCRARLHLGNNVLSSQYDELQRENENDAKTNFTSTVISPEKSNDYSVAGEIWNKRASDAMEDAKNLPGIGLTYDKPYQGDPVIGTNTTIPTDLEKAKERHVITEEAKIEAWKAACESYYYEASYGLASWQFWYDPLRDGTCDRFLIEEHPDFLDKKNERFAEFNSTR